MIITDATVLALKGTASKRNETKETNVRKPESKSRFISIVNIIVGLSCFVIVLCTNCAYAQTTAQTTASVVPDLGWCDTWDNAVLQARKEQKPLFVLVCVTGIEPHFAEWFSERVENTKIREVLTKYYVLFQGLPPDKTGNELENIHIIQGDVSKQVNIYEPYKSENDDGTFDPVAVIRTELTVDGFWKVLREWVNDKIPPCPCETINHVQKIYNSGTKQITLKFEPPLELLKPSSGQGKFCLWIYEEPTPEFGSHYINLFANDDIKEYICNNFVWIELPSPQESTMRQDPKFLQGAQMIVLKPIKITPSRAYFVRYREIIGEQLEAEDFLNWLRSVRGDPPISLPDDDSGGPSVVEGLDGGNAEVRVSENVGQTAVVTGDVVNVRSGASTEASVVAQVKQGATVGILEGPIDSWYRVRADAQTSGWIKGDYLQFNSAGQRSVEQSKRTEIPADTASSSRDTSTPAPFGVWVGDWRKPDKSMHFSLAITKSEDGGITARGKGDTWRFTEYFDGKVTDTEIVLTGVTVAPPPAPGESYTLDTLKLKLSPDGKTLKGTWSDTASKTGDVELTRQ